MVNKADIKCRFRRSIESYDENAFVQKKIVQHLMTLTKEYFSLPTTRILEIGCGTGLLTEQILKYWKECELIINDLVEEMCLKTANRCNLSLDACLPGDIENIELYGTYDLILSASTFQWLAYPEQTLRHLSEHLRPKGELIFSSFGEDNFKELKAITGSGLIYPSMQQMEKMLSLYFDILYSEESHYILKFSEPMEILHHIKKTGVNATAFSRHWTRGHLHDFIHEYTVRFLMNTYYPLTYHPIYWVCRLKSL